MKTQHIAIFCKRAPGYAIYLATSPAISPATTLTCSRHPLRVGRSRRHIGESHLGELRLSQVGNFFL
ncbi:hypothetical protein BGW80DRAFT_1313983, partial [Lactifluus volemus]